MKRFTYIILALFLFFINTYTDAAEFTTKEIKTVSSADGFNINSRLMYPKDKTIKEFKTVVLLHSLGYSSQWWGSLPQDLVAKGYAVLEIDLRGHGKSVYNSRLTKVSWKDMTKTAFAKMPQDVVSVIDTVKKENVKKTFFNEWAIVGCDLGANVGVVAADKLPQKPKTIVMMSPLVETKSIKIPISMAQLDNVDFLTITGVGELDSQKASKYLKRYAQSGYTEYVSKSKTAGMVLLKNDEDAIPFIEKWIIQYFN